METVSPSFYFTKVDPDYSLKGSRDPLGLQVIWQQQGRELIPFLSTVSGNLQDFQILCLAHYLYGKEPDAGFSKFFIRFEQLMAYARLRRQPEAGFSGVDRARLKLKDGPRLSISNTPGDELLSNQRTYGIWGKYSRPFRDLGFTKDSAFEPIFRQKLDRNPAKEDFNRLIAKIRDRASTKIEAEEVDCAKPLLNFYKNEQSLYERLILKVENANPYQNRLFDFLIAKQLPDEFHLYSFLQAFAGFVSGAETSLQQILRDIDFTERVLSPLNRIFRYIQTKPLWTREEILKDAFITKVKRYPDYLFALTSEQNKIKNQLSLTLQKDNWALVEDLIKRNLEVTRWRGGAPWLHATGDILEVHHGEGGFHFPDYDPVKHNDNNYFLDTYVRLFNQIHA